MTENDVMVGQVLDALATIDAPTFTALFEGFDRAATITARSLPGTLLMVVVPSEKKQD